MAMGFIRVAHVQITVPPSQAEMAKEFYIQLLGLKEIEKPDSLKGRGGFWLDGNNIQIHLAVEEGVEREKTKAHVAYEVGNLESYKERLKEKGFVLSSGPDIPGYQRFETRDPFGNRIEFMEKSGSN